MAIWNRQEKEAFRAESPTKHEYDTAGEATFIEGEVGELEGDKEVALHRGLKARHITMIGMHANFIEETFPAGTKSGQPIDGFNVLVEFC